MAEDIPKYNSSFQEQVKGLAIGDNNIIYNYFAYREESKPVPVDLADDNLQCPYRGLYHFSPNDSEYFFGRDFFIEILFEATKTRNFIPILGASGSGKSSVVLAGLIPKLEQEQKGHWKFTHFRPGSDPFHALALALVPLYTPDLDETDQIAQTRKLAGYLDDKTISLSDVFAKIQQNNFNHRILLIADQFEEIYTQCSDQKVRRRFLDCLLACFQSFNSGASSSTVLVTTMRADFLANALSYRPFADMLQNADIKLGVMNQEELKKVIKEPAEKLGVTFEAGLVERILNDLEDEPGNLPLLEFALTELWQKRAGKLLTHKSYETSGEVQGALADYADDKYKSFTEKEQKQAQRIFVQLVRPGEGTEDTRRRANRSELGEESWNLVTRQGGLADSRLVVTSRNDSEQEIVEVVHEALIQNWGQFREWMKEDRKFRVWQEQLRMIIRQWENSDNDNGALLRGAPLAEAEDWQKHRTSEIGTNEQVFINSSVTFRDKEKKEKDTLRQRITTGLALGLLGALGLAGLAGLQWKRAERQLKITRSREILALSEVQSSINAECSLNLALNAYDSAQEISRINLAIFENNLRQALAKSRVRRTIEGFSNQASNLDWHPDGKIIASNNVDSVSIWDIETGKKKTSLPISSKSEDIAWSPDGKKLAVSFGNGDIQLWDTETNQKLVTLQGTTDPGLAGQIKWSPNGKFLASSSSEKDILKIWTVEEQTSISIDKKVGHAIAWSPNGQTIATVSLQTDQLTLWNPFTGENIDTIQTDNLSAVHSLSWSPGGKWIVSGSDDGTVALWNVETKKDIQALTGHNNQVLQVAWSPNGQIFASASWDGTIKLWDIKTKKEITTLTGHTSGVMSLVWSPNGEYLASGSQDKTLRIWNVTKANSPIVLHRGNRWMWDVSWSPNNEFIASASDDRTMRLWSNKAKKTITELDIYPSAIFNLSWSPNGNKLASSSKGIILILDFNTKQTVSIFHNKNQPVYGLAWSPDSKMLASSSLFDDTNELGSVKIWNAETGKNIISLKKIASPTVAWSPDGKHLAFANTLGGAIYLWDVDEKKSEFELKLIGHDKTRAIWGLAWSPDGKMLASASDDDTVKIWNSMTGETLLTLNGHSSDVKGVAWSPDGKKLASASLDKTIRIWDVETGKDTAILTGNTSGVRNVTWSSDGKQLVSASEDGTARLFIADIEELLLIAREQIPNGSTSTEQKKCLSSIF